MNEQQAVLQASGLTKRFAEGQIDVAVLHGIDLTVRAGQTLAIVGQSGSGKSTLLHLLGGLDAPSSGSVRLIRQDFAALTPNDPEVYRHKSVPADFADSQEIERAKPESFLFQSGYLTIESAENCTPLHKSQILKMFFYFRITSDFFNDTATTEIYTLSLHDALPIYCELSGLARSISWLSAKSAGTLLCR